MKFPFQHYDVIQHVSRSGDRFVVRLVDESVFEAYAENLDGAHGTRVINPDNWGQSRNFGRWQNSPVRGEAMSISFFASREVQHAELDLVEELNLSNRNAFLVMERLNWPMDYCGKIAVADLPKFIERCAEALNLMQSEPALDAGIPNVDLTSNHIDCGLPAGYFVDRIIQLRDLAKRALCEDLPLRWG